MVQRIFIFLCALLWFLNLCYNCFSQQTDSLLHRFVSAEDINSIVHEYSTHLEIKNLEKAIYSVEKRVSVLSKEGRDQGRLVLPYDKFRNIKDVSIRLYTPEGELIKKLSKDNIRDYSGTSSYSLYEDNRVKVFSLYHYKYPYEVKIEVKMKFDGLLALPTWNPQSEGEIVQNANLTVVTPATVPINHKTMNLDQNPIINQNNNGKIYYWSWSNLTPLKDEPYGPPKSEILPSVQLAPSVFKIGDTKGNFNSWQGFGMWYYNLSQDRDQLDNSTKSEIKKLLEGVKGDKKRAQKLYTYLQEKTRYVSIQLGMGGWQPFPAEYVHNRGYGDCKALSNYMKTLLDIADIEAYPALINSGGNPGRIQKDFPVNHFNHVILMVKAESDTLWLESTSQKLPFGYIGRSNYERYALLATPEGGKLVKTPTMKFDENKKNNNYKISFDANGNATVRANRKFHGYTIDVLYNQLADQDKEDRVKWLRNRLELNNATFVKTDFSDIDNKIIAPEINYTFNSSDLTQKLGARYFIPVNKFNQWNINLPDDEKRSTYFDIGYPFSERDSTIFKLPDTWQIEAIPESQTIETGFAKASYQFDVLDEHTIKVIREVAFLKEKIQPEKYPDFVSFIQDISHMDSKNFVVNQDQ